ncbi:MAG TPA: signal recognition particle-docking protein FtsY [Methanomassiliicoccales archaeon]|jgi:fused signal recognition particle receptor|nr:signal recognition particle-docking protein FtsY [Euryarchaeota archaeon]HOE52616.1 signal recognition particle-docking protein FtsY [Methanomassiliicoccales archaeon]HPD08226.1 signal recognition particle-docking protein FtsY [Methanomassiliicoccales archaeon]HQM66723.1 signal recognition particle-docking protein FtsY [Methanomassiliicoccales archaeon]
MFESLKKLLGLSKKEIEPTAKVEEVVGDSGKRISERDLDELLWELELVLLEADVALPIVEEIKASVRADLLGKRVDRSYKVEDAIELALKNAVRAVLKGSEFDFDAFVATHERPVVIMFLGINGTGKTTVIAKIAHRLQGQGLSVVLSASDTFRAGAIEQLAVHGERLGAKVVRHQAGGDPAAVAYDAVEHAKARKRDVVLVDTAGRMQTNANLMDEMKKIKRVVRPHLTVFVGDSLAGNDAIEQARAFEREIGIDAVILTKIDADAKGGAALSIAHSIKKPIAFLSTGQGYEDLIRFDSQWMVDRLFGNGRE